MKKHKVKVPPSLITPRWIAELAKRPLAEVMRAIVLANVVPSAFADDVPVFDSVDATKIQKALCRDE